MCMRNSEEDQIRVARFEPAALKTEGEKTIGRVGGLVVPGISSCS